MKIEIIVLSMFGIGMVLGQVGTLEVVPGVRIYLHDILIAVMYAYYTLRLRNVRLIPGFILPFEGAAAVSLLVAFSRMPPVQVLTGSLYLVRWILYSGIAGCVVASSLSPVTILVGTYLATIAIAGIGLIQMVWYPDLRNLMYLGWDPHYRRLFSTLLDPNFTGLVLVLGFVTGLGLTNGRRKWHVSIFMAQTIVTFAIYLTHSRSTYVAFIAAVLAWGIRMKKTAMSAIISLVCVSVLVLSTGTNEWDNLFRTASIEARVQNSVAAIRLFGKSPLFGFGFNTLRFVQCGGGTCADRYGNASHAAAGVDNSILFLLLTTGLLGVYGFVRMVSSVSGIVKGMPRAYTWIKDGFIVSTVAVIAHSLFINSLFYPWTLVYLWVYIGVMQKVRGYTSRSVSRQ